MVFVYIKIYYAARERARRNINKPNFGKRISRKFANLSDKSKGGRADKIEEANKKEALINSSNLSVPQQVNNKSMTNSTQIPSLTSAENTAVATIVSNDKGNNEKTTDEMPCSSSNGKNHEEVELHPIVDSNKVTDKDGAETTVNNNNGILTSVSIENSDAPKSSQASTNGNPIASGCKKKMRFSDDTKGSDSDIDKNGSDLSTNKNTVGEKENTIEVENEGEKKSLLPMKVERYKTEGPQPKQIHPKKKMVHIMSAYAAEEDDDSPQGSFKFTSETLCDKHQIQGEEDVILENPSATEILEVESTKLPHPYGECASARANGVRTRRSVGVSTRTDNNGCGVQTQTCSRVCRRSQGGGGNNKGVKIDKSEEVIVCDESSCGCKYQERTVGAVNQVRSLRTKLRLRFRNQPHQCGASNSNSLSANERRSSKGSFSVISIIPAYGKIR